MREQIIIDTDPGADDALAILLALGEPERLEVKAITAVAGNVPVPLTTRNALRLIDLAGRPDIPVFAGAAMPLIYPLETAEYVSGPDGLAGADLPEPSRAANPGHAVNAIIDLLRSSPERSITLCPIGPLTNIALALRMAPDIAPRIKRIVLMGGSVTLGNVTPAAEYNIYVDPHAADIVFGSGVALVMVGLNLTHQALASRADIAAIGALPNASGQMIHRLLTRQTPVTATTDGHPQHDPCVIGYLLWPELFTGRDCHVDIGVGPGPERGRTTVDWNNRLKRQPNAHVLETINAPVFFKRLTAALARLP